MSYITNQKSLIHASILHPYLPLYGIGDVERLGTYQTKKYLAAYIETLQVYARLLLLCFVCSATEAGLYGVLNQKYIL